MSRKPNPLALRLRRPNFSRLLWRHAAAVRRWPIKRKLPRKLPPLPLQFLMDMNQKHPLLLNKPQLLPHRLLPLLNKPHLLLHQQPMRSR